jgi:hypothetical protein
MTVVKMRKPRIHVFLVMNDYLVFAQLAYCEGISASKLLDQQIQLFTDIDIKNFDRNLLEEIRPRDIVKNRNITAHFINFNSTVAEDERLNIIADKLNEQGRGLITISDIVQFIVHKTVANPDNLLKVAEFTGFIADISELNIPNIVGFLGEQAIIENKIVKNGKLTSLALTKQGKMQRIDLTLQENICDKIREYADNHQTTISEIVRDWYPEFTDTEFAKYAPFMKKNVPLTPAEEGKYHNPDGDPRGPYRLESLEGVAADRFFKITHEIKDKITKKVICITDYDAPGRGWNYSYTRMKKFINDDEILWPKDSHGQPQLKIYLSKAPGLTPEGAARFSNPDGDKQGPYILKSLEFIDTAFHYPIINPATGTVFNSTAKGWKFIGTVMEQCIKKKQILWPEDDGSISLPHLKKYFVDATAKIHTNISISATLNSVIEERYNVIIKQQFPDIKIDKSSFFRAFMLFICDKIDKILKLELREAATNKRL